MEAGLPMGSGVAATVAVGIKNLFAGKVLHHRIVRGSQQPLCQLWLIPYSTAEQGREVALIFIKKDGTTEGNIYFSMTVLDGMDCCVTLYGLHESADEWPAWAGRKIWHARRLRQGDPLYPMLFVLVMEVVNAMISAADSPGVLQPLPSTRIRNRASLYVDDLVIFLFLDKG
jgi:hypothetical protein